MKLIEHILAYATGFIEGKDMAKVGIILGVSGLMFLYLSVLVFI